MSREIFVSSSFEEHAKRVQIWLGRQTARRVLLVSEGWGAADEIARRTATMRRGRLGIHRYRPAQLAAELAIPGLAREGLSSLTGLGFEALCARVAHRCRGSGLLDYLLPVVETPGFVRSLAATIRELRLQQLDSEAPAPTGPPGVDLSRLMASFEEELRERRLADLARTYELAASAPPGRFDGMPLVLHAWRPRSRAEEAFLARLAKQAPSVLATVLNGDETSRAVFRRVLGEAAGETAPEPSDTGSGGGTRLQRLRRYLFTLESASDEVSPGDTSVEFFSEPGQGREAVEVARRIRGAVEAGLRFDQVAVLLRDPGTYYPLVEDALRRAGIPAFFSRGTVRPDPAGRAFLALLECATEDLSAQRFAEYLSLGQAPIPDESGAPSASPAPWVEPDDEQLCFKTTADESVTPDPITPDLETDPVIAGSLRTPAQWEQLLVEASVIGGFERWKRRLDGLIAEVELNLSVLEAGSFERRRLTEKQRRLEDLKRFALPLVEELSRLPTEANWTAWISALELLAISALQDPTSVLKLLAELRPMGEVGPVGLDEVRRVLSDRLTLLRRRPESDRYGKVFVATPEEVPGCSFPWVFLTGLAEGLFPRKALEDPLLLDLFRRPVGLESALERRRREERLLLRTAVGCAATRLIVSYPRMDLQQGRSRVPSFYALDVVRAAEGRLPDVGKLEKQAALASSTRLGWPAPRDPQRSIDDTEYDLAVLEPMLKSAQPEVGAARFLLQVNPQLARSLRGRWQRWNSRRFTPADGLVDASEEAATLLSRQRLKVRPYSPTSLQTFAACPYKFFLYAVQRLEPREEAVAVEQLDPLTRGALFHQVQFRLLTQLRERGELPIRTSNQDQVAARAESILKEVARDYEDRLSPAIPRIWKNEIAQLGADMRGWIREQAGERSDWVPERFEFAFGLPPDGEHDPRSRAEPAKILDGFCVRGSIDLLERSPGRQTFRVTDHKTGRAPQERTIVVQGGRLLQPLLYSLAVESLLEEPVELGRLFYCTQRGDFRSLEVPVDSLNSRRLQTVLEIIDEAVAGNFLPAAPDDKACGFCDYRPVCGPHEELRVSRYKDPQPLARLFQLRKLP